jgi:uncharacterized protein YecE (DUF72 family)
MMQLNKTPFYIGTSGYNYKDWQDIIYPPNLNTNSYLSYYVNKFNLNFLELSFTFYKMPFIKTSKQIVEHVDKNFKFSIKLHKSVLQGNLKDSNIDEFKTGIYPFIKQNKIASFLADFPYEFKANIDNLKLLKDIKSKFTEFPLFSSLPHRSWYKERYINALKENRIGMVIHIIPEFKVSNTPYLPVATNDECYFRLYSNPLFWRSSTNKECTYSFNEDTLKQLLIDIKKLSYVTQNIYVVFCNVKNGTSLLNAINLKKLVEMELTYE